jgi:dipeptidyl aminopeptidase/acylaminoacyl peptidase
MARLLIVFISFSIFSSVHAQSALMNVTDLVRIRSAGSITLSPNGNRAAFVVTAVERDEPGSADFHYVNQIFLVLLRPVGKPVQLTFSKEGAAQPAWNPSGNELAFTRTTGGKSQIFVLSMDGGEAWQLTHSRYGSSSPRWSPDGKKILFASSAPLNDLVSDSDLNPAHDIPKWASERPGFRGGEEWKGRDAKEDPDGSLSAVRAFLEKDAADGKAKVVNRLNFQDEFGVNPSVSFTNWFITDVDKSARPKRITRGFYRFNDVSFTPDGKRLLVSANLDSIQHPDRSQENAIYLANLNGDSLTLVAGEKHRSYTNPVLSPSGKWLAVQYSPADMVSVPVLAVVPLTAGSKDMRSIVFDRTKENLHWSADEHYLYFTAASNGGAPLYRVDMATNKVEQLSEVDKGINSFAESGDAIVYTQTSVNNPSELFVADGSMKNAKQLTSLNSWVTSKTLSLPERRSFQNSQGMTVDYWVMKPANYTPGKKFPLLLEIHGGPSAMWGPGEASMWHEFQYFCSKGYGVVYCNPRGSGGYGETFLRANVKDWGEGPTSDVLSALDRTVADGWADTTHLYITGGSYAGYLVAWIIEHDHRFRAACSQRGVYDLATFFGEGNAWRLVPLYFGGYPWQPEVRKLLVDQSPISYVDRITTPYIIFHGENDRRTGFVQGEMMFRSLKVLGRPVEYVRHPGATHEITRSGDNRQRIDQMLRTYEFFERFK